MFAQNTKSIQKGIQIIIKSTKTFFSPSLPGEDDNFPNLSLTVSNYY